MRSVRLSRSQIVAILILPAILAVLFVLFVVAMIMQGRPFLYASERMRTADKAFKLYKIRTMSPVEGAREMALGGHQHRRVTPLGHILRRTRLDELPQIFNVLKGDIGFIGPRPPLRRHVEACPKTYGEVLDAMRPGITGLSTILVHQREERLLSRCRSDGETEEVYVTHCLPLKLKLDMLYARRRTVGLDLLILWRTARRLTAWGGLFQTVDRSKRPVAPVPSPGLPAAVS